MMSVNLYKQSESSLYPSEIRKITYDHITNDEILVIGNYIANKLKTTFNINENI